MKKIFAAGLSVLMLCSCSKSSGILKMGPDTYSLSTFVASDMGGEIEAKKRAVTEAGTYCGSLSKEMLVTGLNAYNSSNMGMSGGTIDVTFQCLSADDPALKRPEFERPADIVIENR